VIDTTRIVYTTVERPSRRLSVRLSVCLSVRPSRHLSAVRRYSGLLLWARRPGGVDRLLHGRRSAANASSITLSAD